MKRSELKSDPEATRAFVQRGRERAAANARERERKPLRAARVDGGVKVPAKRVARPQVKFRARGRARDQVCELCAGVGPHRAAQWHHWLPQQQIRVFVRGLRLVDEEHDRVLRELLRDERNLSALCVARHMDHEGGGRPFARSDVPSSAFEFAAELGPEWLERLRRAYPEPASERLEDR